MFNYFRKWRKIGWKRFMAQNVLDIWLIVYKVLRYVKHIYIFFFQKYTINCFHISTIFQISLESVFTILIYISLAERRSIAISQLPRTSLAPSFPLNGAWSAGEEGGKKKVRHDIDIAPDSRYSTRFLYTGKYGAGTRENPPVCSRGAIHRLPQLSVSRIVTWP